MVSNHYRNKRYKRENIIKKRCNGDGRVIDSFVVDKGHVKGLERHCVTDTGIIIIFNVKTNKLITKKIARPQQIKNLYMTKNKTPPKWLLDLAKWHVSMGMNNL